MIKFKDAENVDVYKISNGIILYKNAFKNIDKTLSFFKEAESYEKDTYMMKKFYNWGGYGIMTEIDSSSFHDFTTGFFNPNEPEEVKQKSVFENIYSVYQFVKEDFMAKYGNSDIWPKHYSKINLFNEGKNTKIAFLKYETNKIIESPEFEFNFTAFHSDFFEQDMDTPGYKLIFTVMLYLNDDYSGGEICFWDGEKLVGYKPEPGDIIAFPSCEPFYHGVLNIRDNDRYALRMNYCAVSEGSKEFKNGTFKPSLNYTNYRVGYNWTKDGKTVITNPKQEKNITVDPPLMLTTKEMEKVSVDAKN